MLVFLLACFDRWCGLARLFYRFFYFFLFSKDCAVGWCTFRDPIFNKDEVWVATQPKDIVDYGDQESTIIKYELMFQQKQIESLAKLNQELLDKKEEESAQKDVLAHQIAGLYEENARMKEQIDHLIKSKNEKDL